MELNFRKKYPSIDSCVILRVIQGDVDSQRKAALDLLLNGNSYYVDEVAIMETAYVLRKLHIPRSKIVEDLTLFLSSPMIIYDEAFFTPIFEQYASHPSLSMDDLVLAARAEREHRTPLYTFDKKLAHQSPAAELIPA